MNIDRKQIVLILIIVAMAAGFFFLQYLPAKAAIQKSKEMQKEQELANAQELSQQDRIPELIAQLEKLSTKAGDFEDRIPGNRNFGSFLSDVTSIMTKFSLNEQMVRPGEEQKYENINLIPVTMECSGDLSQIFAFFKDIESSKRLFRIEQLRLENKKYGGNVKVFAKGSIFYRQEI